MTAAVGKNYDTARTKLLAQFTSSAVKAEVAAWLRGRVAVAGSPDAEYASWLIDPVTRTIFLPERTYVEKAPKPVTEVRLTEDSYLKKLEGVWYLVTTEVTPPSWEGLYRGAPTDVITGLTVWAGNPFGPKRYNKAKRTVSHKELKAHGLAND